MNTVKLIFEKILGRNLAYLENRNYKLQGIETQERSELLSSAIIATLINKDADRVLIFKYYESGLIWVSIKQLNPPELDWDDYTSTNSMRLFSSNINKSEELLEEELNLCFEETMSLFKTKFHAVLEGDEFQSDQIDWGNQK